MTGGRSYAHGVKLCPGVIISLSHHHHCWNGLIGMLHCASARSLAGDHLSPMAGGHIYAQGLSLMPHRTNFAPGT